MHHPVKAIVSGHSGGLGAAIAEQFLVRGLPVLGCARRSNPALRERFPELLSEVALDLSDAAAHGPCTYHKKGLHNHLLFGMKPFVDLSRFHHPRTPDAMTMRWTSLVPS